MRDRIPKYAGRVKLIPVSNQPNTYDMQRADEPLQEGTPLNRNTLLSDQTVEEFGLSLDATPDEALRFLNDRWKEFKQTSEEDYEEFKDIVTETIKGVSRVAFGNGTWGREYVGDGKYLYTSEIVVDFLPQVIIRQISPIYTSEIYSEYWLTIDFSDSFTTTKNDDGTYIVRYEKLSNAGNDRPIYKYICLNDGTI